MTFAFYNREFSFIFQNRNDSFELQSLGILSLKNKIFWIKGSGVDLNVFKHSVLPSFEKIIILFPTRMLWDKGVNELREATILLKEKYQDKIQFVLSGMADEENKAGVPSKYLLDWQDDGYVKWIGYQFNMIEVYQSSHIVILPSYREGIPKSLIEACSIGRAIITTNGIGCKECVDDGVNGILVPVKDSFSLSNSIINLVSDSSKIHAMGLASRIKAEKEFDINLVIASHHEIYNQYI
jgi:glycosyltransferase involved in cell wall biosynthesis